MPTIDQGAMCGLPHPFDFSRKNRRHSRLAKRFTKRHVYVSAMICLWFSVVAGCDRSGPRRLEVQGTVSFQGTPVDDGEIVFSPQTSGLPMAVGQIASGQYAVPKSLGPASGMYEVKITAFKKTGKKVSPSPYSEQKSAQDEVEQIIPAKFNEATQLQVELHADRSQYDFSLDPK